MTYENDPPRLTVSGAPSDPFIRALETARMELPTEEELGALAGRLTSMTGGRRFGMGPLSTARTRLRAKSIQAGLFALAAAVGVGATMKYEGVFPFYRPPALPEVIAPAAAPTPVPAPRERTPAVPVPSQETSAAPEPQPEPDPAVQHPRNTPVKTPAHEPPSATVPSQGDLPASDVDGVRSPEAEIALLNRAHQSLSFDAARALSLTEQHRRDYPSGALGQESDVIAVEALAALGRTAEAEAAAARFRARYPSSAHLRRLDRVVGQTAPRGQ